MVSKRQFFFFMLMAVAGFQQAAYADVTLTFGANTSENKEVSELVTKNAKATSAINAFVRGDLRQCEELLKEAYSDSKDLPKVDVMMARLLIQNGQYLEALSRLENYLRVEDKDPEAHASLGEIALRTGRWSDAWLQFRESMTLINASSMSKARREDFTARLTQLRAETAEARGDFETADKLYQELEKLIPSAGYPIWAQGRLKVMKEDLKGGFELLKRAKVLDKNLPQPELTMAQSVAASNLKDGAKLAESWFQDGLNQKETRTNANWFEYAKWLLTQDRPEHAQMVVKKSEGDYRDSKAMKFIDAFALRFLGKIPEAEVAFSALHDTYPTDPEITDQLALVLIESTDQGKKLRAQQLAETNLRRAPNEESAIATYAWVQFRLGVTDVANRIFGELAARGPINPQSAYYIGKLLESGGRDMEAIGLYETAINSPGLFVQRRAIRDWVTERKAKIEADNKQKEKEKAKANVGITDKANPEKKTSEPAAMKQPDAKALDSKTADANKAKEGTKTPEDSKNSEAGKSPATSATNPPTTPPANPSKNPSTPGFDSKAKIGLPPSKK